MTPPSALELLEIQETTKTLGVELYRSQKAAATLGRFLGMDKSRPEQSSALVDARAFVVAVLESGDKKALAALDAIARKMYPEPPDPITLGRKRLGP
jgi:hypothetical protein